MNKYFQFELAGDCGKKSTSGICNGCPKCTPMSPELKQEKKCCELCRPNTLEKKNGLDTCRQTMCACHWETVELEKKKCKNCLAYPCDCHQVKPEPEYRAIKIVSGEFVLVDAEDFETLNKHKWYKTKNSKARPDRQQYIATTILPKITVFMHRMVMKTPKGLETDHIDGNTFDNRKSNLRICTKAENQRNAKLRKDSTTGLKGILWHRARKRWIARIRHNGKSIHLGTFINKDDARKARHEAEKKYHGEFARKI